MLSRIAAVVLKYSVWVMVLGLLLGIGVVMAYAVQAMSSLPIPLTVPIFQP